MNWKSNQRRQAIALADSQRAVTCCAICGRVVFRGLVRDGKAALRVHRERCRKGMAA